MKHIHYKNDFEFLLKIMGKDGAVRPVPQHRWSVVFSVDGVRYECSLRDGNAVVKGDTIVCRLQDHGFGCGELKAEFREWIPNKDWLDGVVDVSTPIDTGIELWEEKSDEAEINAEVLTNIGGGERGVIYLDINDSSKLRVLGAEQYLNDEYVPFIFRKTRKANTYRVKENGQLTRYRETTRKGWHPMGQIGQCAVDKNGVVSVRKDVFNNGASKEMSTLPQYFVQDGWLVRGEGSKTTVPYGRSRIELEKELVQDETTGMMRTKWRRVRLLYGIAFIKKRYVDKVTRLDLSKLATNIATFHVCWDGTQYVPEGNLEEWSDNFHWIFNK
nr:MAG TPA: hypothetical protein [Caudoviricetes sp.]